MKRLLVLLILVFPFPLLAQTFPEKDVKLGLVKKVAHGHYTATEDTLVEGIIDLSRYYDRTYSKTIYTLSDCSNFNLTLTDSGNLIYNNVNIGNYSYSEDSLYFHYIRRIYRERISNLKDKYAYSFLQDTVVLTTQRFSLYYLPCNKLNGPSYHDRPLKTAYYNWGIVGGINYQFDGLFYELGISKSELSDSTFYSADFYLEYNPVAEVVGLNASAYISAQNPKIRHPLSFLTIGANFNIYTNFHKVNVGLRPLVGVHLLRHKLKGLYLFYGYNVFLNKKRIPQLSHHVLELKLNLPLLIHKEKHIIRQTYYFLQGGSYAEIDKDL